MLKAGTKIKVIFSKLGAMEQTAKKLFNKDVSNVVLDDKYSKVVGTKSLNADVLSQLARKDLPLALELMSKLKVEGVLAGQTLQKIFTQRHALDAEVLLTQINGDIDTFTNKLTKGLDYAQDFDKQMFSLTNNLKILANNLSESSLNIVNFFTKPLTGMLMFLNTITDVNTTMGKVVGNTLNTLTSLGQSVIGITLFGKGLNVVKENLDGVGLSFTKLLSVKGDGETPLPSLLKAISNISLKNVKEFKESFSNFSSILGQISKNSVSAISRLSGLSPVALGISASIMALGYAYYYFKKRQQESLETINKSVNSILQLEGNVYSLQGVIESATIVNKKFAEGFKVTDENVTLLVNSSQFLTAEFYNMYTALKNLADLDYSKVFSNTVAIEQNKKNLNAYEKELETFKNKIDKLISSDDLQSLKGVRGVSQNELERLLSGKNAEKKYSLVKAYFSGSPEEKDKVVEELKELGTTIDKELQKLSFLYGESWNKKTIESIEKINEAIGKQKEEINKLTDEQKKYLDYNETFNQNLLAQRNNRIENNFSKGLFRDKEDNIHIFNGKNGKEYINALFDFAIDESVTTLKQKISELDDEIKAKTDELNNEKDKNRKWLLKTQLEDSKQRRENLVNNTKTLGALISSVLQESVIEGIGGIENISSDMISNIAKSVMTVARSITQTKIAQASDISVTSDDDNYSPLQLVNKYNTSNEYAKSITKISQEVKAENQELKELLRKRGKTNTKTDTKYEIERVLLKKEELNLEMELLKLGKSKAEQDMISQQYAMKKITLAKEEIDFKLQNLRLKLSEFGLEKASVSELEKRKQSLESMGTVKGDKGKALKDEHALIVNYLNTRIDLINKANELEIEGVKIRQQAYELLQQGLLDTYKSIVDTKQYLYENRMMLGIKVDENELRHSLDTYVKELNLANVRIVNQIDMSGLSEEYRNTMQQLAKAWNENKFNPRDLDLVMNISLKEESRLLTEIEKYNELLKDPNLSKTQKDEYTKQLMETNKKLEDVRKTTKDVNSNTKTIADISVKNEAERNQTRVGVADSLGGLLKGIGGEGKFGGLLGAFVDIGKGFVDKNSPIHQWLNNNAKFNNILDAQGNVVGKEAGNGIASALTSINKVLDSDKWAGVGNAFNIANYGIQAGSSLGSAFGDTTGESKIASSIGALGGMGLAMLMGKGLMAAGPWGAVAGAVIGGIVGAINGRYAKKVKKAQQEANAKTEQANKQYEGNSNKLGGLAQNFNGLQNVIEGLNKSLLSTFSNLPTIDNISRITLGLNRMYTDFNTKSRDFGSAGYLTEHEKRVRKSMFGGKTSVKWYQFNEINQSGLLSAFGTHKRIEELSHQELENFSKFLKSYKKGVNDNFKLYAEVVDQYLGAIKNLHKVMTKFGEQATYEGFAGISVTRQEELVKQITEMYKLANIKITTEVENTIKELAEEMSVMVTIMENVRTEYINVWKSTGKASGKSFIDAMKPYMDSMITNMTQIYFDTNFSRLTRVLESEFKGVADKLYEIKQKGIATTWRNIYSGMKPTFAGIVDLLVEGKQKTDLFNTALRSMQETASDRGLMFSEMQSLGLLTTLQTSLYEVFKQGLNGDEMNSAITSLGQSVGSQIGEAMTTKLIDGFLSNRLSTLSRKLEDTLGGSMSLTNLSELSQMALSTGLQLESERLKLSAIRDMFDFNKDINYQNQNNEIKYETGTSQTIVNNFYLTGQVNAGVVIPQNTVDEFVDNVTDTMLSNLKTNKGIDLNKVANL